MFSFGFYFVVFCFVVRRSLSRRRGLHVLERQNAPSTSHATWRGETTQKISEPASWIFLLRLQSKKLLRADGRIGHGVLSIDDDRSGKIGNPDCG